jgi:protein-tyrosine phosphatase
MSENFNITNTIKYYSYYVYGKLRSYYHYYSTDYIANNSMNEIIDGIYIGDIYSASNYNNLEKNNIKSIVCCVVGIDDLYPKYIDYLNLDLIDNCDENITRVFDVSNKFIESNIKDNKKILIHCIAGVSRSVTLLIAYLIKNYDYNPEKALEIIKKHRNIANPNENFMKQLHKYYTDIQLSKQL